MPPEKLGYAVIVFCTGALFLSVYTLNILFTDGMSFSRSSYKHLLTISSDAIRSFPVLGAVDEPIYYYSSADGPNPSVQEVSYLSGLDQLKLQKIVLLFLENQVISVENIT